MATSYQRINQWRSDVQPGKPAPPKVLPRATSAPPTIYANDSISVVASRPYQPPRPAPIPVPGSAPIPPKRAATLKRPSNTTSGLANAHARSPSQPSLPSQPSSGAFSKLFGRLKSPNNSRAPSQNRGESPAPAPARRATSPPPVTSAAPKSSSTQQQQQQQQQQQVPVQYVQYPGLSNGQLQYYTVLPNGTLSAPVTPGSTPGAYYYHPMTATSLPPVQTCPACGTPVLTNELHMHLRAHGYQI